MSAYELVLFPALRYRLEIDHPAHGHGREDAVVEIREHAVIDRRDVLLACDGLDKDVRRRAGDAVVALDLVVAEAREKLKELFQMIRLGIVKLGQLGDDALSVGIAFVEKPHRLDAEPLAAVPRKDRHVLEQHIAVQALDPAQRIGDLQIALVVIDDQQLLLAA